MTRSRLIPLLNLFAILALALAACAPAATPTPATVRETVVAKETVLVPQEKVVTATPEPAGPVTLTFWHTYGEGGNTVQTDKLDQLIAQFEADNPGVKIQSESIPYNDFHQKLLTAIAGGTAPDLARLDIIWIPEFAQLGALAALDEVMPDFAEYKSSVFPGPLSTNAWKDHYYGLPLDTNTRTFMWNEAVYAQAGLTASPKTVEEMTADCEKILAAASVPCFGDGGTYGWAVMPWIWTFGGDITDPAMTTSTGYVNGPETVAAYTFLKDMLDKGYLHGGILGGGFDGGGLFSQDQVASLLEGPWMPGIFASQYPNKPLAWAPMPAGAAGSISVVGGEDIALFQQSKNKAAAADFVRFMLSPEAQLAMAETGQVPVRTDVTEQAVKSQPYFQYFFDQLQTAKARLPHPNWPKIESILSDAGQLILRGEMTPQQALDEAAAKIDPLLK